MCKKLFLAFFLFAAILSVDAQIYNSLYIDFGPNDGTNGNVTSSPDANGNYWNNATDPSSSAATINLVNDDNVPTGFHLDISSALSSNGILNGGLLEPSSALLNEYAISSATEDYFFTSSNGSITLSDLNPNRGYVFNLFATRSNSETRTTEYRLFGLNEEIYTLTTSGIDIGDSGYDGNNNIVIATDTVMPDANGTIQISISRSVGTFGYLGLMRVDEVNAAVVTPFCTTREPFHIAVMGSSVAYGQGATNHQGYAYQYGQLLTELHNEAGGNNWNISNISVPGNNTTALMNRWQADLPPLCSKYVVYGLSLGNEGITSGGQAIFDLFRDNLLQLIDDAQSIGITPVIANCYTRSDFNATTYNYIKQMDLLIHEWDVASINLLGAVDDGFGHWAPGHFADGGHPNDIGHQEMSYAMVPSLFEALAISKPQPSFIAGTSLSLDPNTSGYKLELTPEGTLHAFTISFDVKTTSTGSLVAFETTDGMNQLTVNGNGQLQYNSSVSSGISGNTFLNDGTWHRVTLTHYYARGETLLYLDNTEEGRIEELQAVQKFTFNDSGSAAGEFSDIYFYRAGMTSEEIAEINSDQMLKSSLEIYSPLDAQGIIGSDTLINLAQSTNRIKKVNTVITSTKEWSGPSFQLFPNPTHNQLTISGCKEHSTLQLFDAYGHQLESSANFGSAIIIDLSDYEPGVFFVSITDEFGNSSGMKRIIKMN